MDKVVLASMELGEQTRVHSFMREMWERASQQRKKPNQNTDEEKYNAEGNVQMKAFDRLKPRIIWNFIRLWCIASGSIFQEIYLIACFKKTALICFKYGKRPATIVSRATAEKKNGGKKTLILWMPVLMSLEK